MAVVELQETWDGRECTYDSEGVRHYIRTFRVRTDSTWDGPEQVVNCTLFKGLPGIPAIYDFYIEPGGFVDEGAVCVKVVPRQDQDDPMQWIVTAEYSSREPKSPEQARDSNRDNKGPQENPLLRPPVIKVSMAKYNRPIDRALLVGTFKADGTPVVQKNPPILWSLTNSACERFDPPVEIDDSRPVLTITRNEPGFDFGLAIQFQDAVNTDEFAGLPPGIWKVDSIEAESAYENGIFYWKVTYTFHGRWDGWNPMKILDQGFHYLDGNLLLGVNRDKEGSTVGSPVLLNGQGGPLNLPYEAYNPNLQPVYVHYIVYTNQQAFSQLGLPL